MKKWMMFALVAMVGVPGAVVAGSAAEMAFEKFEGLAGEWKGETADGQPVHLVYEPVSSGKAVFEKLTIGEGDKAHGMSTMYHLDGDRMMLTHYCATGNQPRMASAGLEGDSVSFDFVDVTGVESEMDGHMHSASFTFPSEDRFENAWTWYDQGEAQFTVAVTAHRVGGPGGGAAAENGSEAEADSGDDLTALAAQLPPGQTLELTAEDRAELLDHLAASREKFVAAVDGLSDEQLHWKPAEDRWSVSECAEHLAAAEELILGAAQAALAGEAVDVEATSHDGTIVAVVPDRSQKFQAPDPLQPNGRYGSFDATMEAWEAARAVVVETAETSDDLRSHSSEHPLFGSLDAYGWLLFTSTHTERHTAQIEEVKAEAGFPGG